jgi:hypothetical protein
MVDVSVDSPDRSDAAAVASKVAHEAALAFDPVTPSWQSLPGPIVQSVFDRPIIEVDPSGDPTC